VRWHGKDVILYAFDPIELDGRDMRRSLVVLRSGLSRLRRSAIGCRRFLRAGKTGRRDLSWRPIGGAIVAASRQVSSVRQEDDRFHQADGTYRVEADPFLIQKVIRGPPSSRPPPFLRPGACRFSVRREPPDVSSL
jgi:hypothetical protein